MLKKLSLIVFLSLLIIPSLVKADGGMFPRPGYWVGETEQKAVIFYDKEVETLVISTTFRGDASNFAWVVPTPSKPEVSRSNDEIFTALAELTSEKNIEPYPVPMMYRTGAVAESGVEIIEQKKVEYYDITVLTADDPEALAKWLNENNYQFPEKAKYILNSYIENKWYFTAVKIDTESLSPAVETQLREGNAVPLKLVFPSKNIVYPMKISGVIETFSEPPIIYQGENQGEIQQVNNVSSGVVDSGSGVAAPSKIAIWPRYSASVPITLYVFADHKKDLPGFQTQYAGWVKSKEIEKLAIEDNGNSWVKTQNSKYYLTKLYDQMKPSEMTSDLYLRDANDNKSVGVAETDWSKILINILIYLICLVIIIIALALSPVGVIFGAGVLVQFLVKNQVARIIAWVFQILVLLFWILLGLIYLLGQGIWQWSNMPMSYRYGTNYSMMQPFWWAIVTIYILWLLGMVATMIIQIIYRQRKFK
jgi:hypothetical protein